MILTIPIFLLLIVCIGMPLGYAWRVWHLDEPTLGGWFAKIAEAVIIVILVLIVGRWDIAGYYARFALMGLVGIAVMRSVLRHAHRPWLSADGRPLFRSHWRVVLSASLLGGVLAYILVGILPKDDARPLAFPLEGGRFMVGQGGANPLLNHHFGHRSQRHAADITAVNAAGFRASGLLPDDLKRYVIFDAVVVSPCDGVVISAENDLPDLVPPNADPGNPAGNHLIIACDGIEIELAHLRKGSVTVGAGDVVAARQHVARVGNSGNTTEPHLHIHAIEPSTGEGVRMSFSGRAPIRNSMFRR